MYRGNVDKVLRDADRIAWQLEHTRMTVEKLRNKYHCCHATIMLAIRRKFTDEEWLVIRKRKLAQGGIKYRFKKGHACWNKGTHFKAGGRSVLTQFKKGHLRGKAARLWRPIGTVTVRSDKPPRRLQKRKRKVGMPPWPHRERRFIKVKDTGLVQQRWIPYARYLWVKFKGPIPAGYFVAHKDGDTMNDKIENYVLVNHRTALKLQRARDPETMVVKARIKINQALRKKKNAAQLVKRHRIKLVVSWHCYACGADYEGQDKPELCIKCGSSAFEQLKKVG